MLLPRAVVSYISSSVTRLSVSEYIGESSRTSGERYKEHLKAPSPIFQHRSTTGHTKMVDNIKIIGREGHNMARAIKETIYI